MPLTSKLPTIPGHIHLRRGFSAMYTIIMLVALCGLVSLGVDIGHVQLAKSELQTAADAAVRAAAQSLPDGTSAAADSAVDAAAANTCDGTPVVLDRNADIEYGTWDKDAKTFTPLGAGQQSSANAIRITARRIAARSTAIPLAFARVVGRSTCDIHAYAIAMVTVNSGGGGFVGLNGVDFKNNALVASYDSRWTQIPTQASAYSHGMLASNAAINTKNNDLVMGDVQLGPSGSVNGPSVSGSTKKLTSAIEPPPMPDWSPSTNPRGLPQNYTASGAVSLPGGTYWFTSLTVDGVLSFSGPATVYVDGNVTVNGSIIADDFRPTNLTIYQLGSNRTFGDSGSNGMVVIATVQAPGADFVAKNSVVFAGSGTFDTITAKNNAGFFSDESASGGGSGGSGQRVISLVH